MTTPQPTSSLNQVPPGHLDQALAAIRAELRALYAETFRLTHTAAVEGTRLFETPDGTGPVDPDYAADTAACRAVNRHQAAVIGRWLPGARLHTQCCEPAVVETTWAWHGHLVAIDLDYTHDFGDPAALTVREVRR